jgi:outer membrane protein TolC
MKSIHYIFFILALGIALPGATQQQLTLQDALTLAQQANPELKASALEVRKAQAQKTVARSLFLPTVYAGAQANHYFSLPAFFGFGENGEGGKIPYGRFGGDDQLAAAVTASQPLYNPSAFPALELSRVKEQQVTLEARAKQLEILSEIKQTYLQILVLHERIRLKEESIHRNERVLQDSRLLFLQGKGLRVDTLRAYTSLKNLEPDLVKLTFEAETKKLGLKTLIGIDSASDFVLVDSLVIPSSENIPSEEEVYAEAKNNNPVLQAIRVQSLVEKQNSRFASSFRKPTLSLLAQYQIQSQTNNLDYGQAHYPSSSFVGLQLSIPIFSGFATQAKIRQAGFSREQADLRSNYNVEKLRADVHQAISRNKEAQLRLTNTAVVQETAQLSYNIIQYRYKNGISQRLELTDAELALSTAQSNHLEAAYDYLAARIELRKLMGIPEIGNL